MSKHRYHGISGDIRVHLQATLQGLTDQRLTEPTGYREWLIRVCRRTCLYAVVKLVGLDDMDAHVIIGDIALSINSWSP